MSATATYRRQPRRERWERDIEANAAFRAEEERRRREREERLRPNVRATQAATMAWQETQARVSALLPETTFRLWIQPIHCLGEVDGALAVAAPAGIRVWTERRYGSFLGNIVREASDFRGIFFFVADYPEQEDDGCL
jgi:hypothetical protein